MAERGKSANVSRTTIKDKGERLCASLLYLLSINLRCRQVVDLQIALWNP